MKRISGSTIGLILGIVLFLVGCFFTASYEEAKENGYEVDATIVEVVEKIENDIDSGYTSTSYTVYADYTVDGKEYKHQRIGKYYDTDEYYVGKTVKTVVDPNSPDRPKFEGGIFCVVGFIATVASVIVKIANGKSKKQNSKR